jgi:predicted ferric reductase
MPFFIYSGLLAMLAACLTIFLYGKKIGYNNLKERHYVVIVCIYYIPFIIIPGVIESGYSYYGKIIFGLCMIVFGGVKYYVDTVARQSVLKMRNKIKNSDDNGK